VIESVLCFQLSIQIQFSLIVIGASEGKNVHFLYVSRGLD